MTDKRIPELKYALNRLYRQYNHRDLVGSDPLQFVYHFSKPADMEIMGFLASALAYGRVRQIEKSLSNLLERMGENPFEYVTNFDFRRRKRLKNFRHRFTSGQDLSDLFTLFHIIFDRYGSIENCFLLDYDPNDRTIVSALSKFCDRLWSIHSAQYKDQVSRGLKFLLADPAGGSACKRLNLFLRWMIRDDAVDTGLWKSIDPAKLIVPVDVHMARLCKILSFYNQRTISLSTAITITENFREIEPADPVKYDFALSRIGIVENCDGIYRTHCKSCPLIEFCYYGTNKSVALTKTG